MAYEYFKLSFEERNKILAQRKSQHYPLHSPPHPVKEGGYYLIIAATFYHKILLITPERRTSFQKLLLEGFETVQADIVAWVILPNHYHILVGVDFFEKISSVIGNLHGKTACEWNLEDQCTNQRKVWFRYADRGIRNDNHFYRAINYIHINPFKHGVVREVSEWDWSSLPLYYETLGREWLRNKWRLYPPEKLGGAWDEFPEQAESG